ncbi:MAG TPA: hypothetical protein VFX28_05110 [Methylomirabilota bacterium]|nr:hypothetical protein [Methylomirabilota bacterium]
MDETYRTTGRPAVATAPFADVTVRQAVAEPSPGHPVLETYTGHDAARMLGVGEAVERALILEPDMEGKRLRGLGDLLRLLHEAAGDAEVTLSGDALYLLHATLREMGWLFDLMERRPSLAKNLTVEVPLARPCGEPGGPSLRLVHDVDPESGSSEPCGA